MSLQLRLTLSLLGLLLALALIAGFGLSRLTRDLQQAVAESAGAVGRSLVGVLHEARTIQRDSTPAGSDSHTHIERREMRVVINGRELSPAEIEALGPDALPEFDPQHLRFELKREDGPTALRVIGLGREMQIALPDSPVQTAVQQFSSRLGWGLLVLVVLGMAGAWLIARRLAQPLQALAAASAALGSGAHPQPITPAGPPELKASILAFNRMAADLQRLHTEAERAREDRALAELGEIGRGLAHSLRNPLHALGLSLEALAAGGAATQGGQALLAGREQLARIDQALRGFLALASGSGAKPEPVALAEVIDDVVLEASQRAAGRVRIERELQPIRLPAVAAELRILVHTLVLNALEASPEGGCLRIRLHAGDAEGEACVEVEDEGDGLPPQVRARLFEPHVSSKPTGAGMGLFLSARLARQRYGGDIEFEELKPRGTRARLRLRPRRATQGKLDEA